MKDLFKKKGEILVVYIILVAIVIVGAVVNNKTFLTPLNIGNILEQATTLGILSLGAMLPILLGGIDLSNGALISLATCLLTFSLPGGFGMNIFLCLLFGLGVGAFNGFGVTTLKLPPFIMTLSTMMIINGFALKILPVPGGSVPSGFMTFLNGRFGIVTHGIIVWAILAIVMFIVLNKTVMGRNLYAVGGNANTAALSGISVRRTNMFAYIVSGLIGSLAGLFLTARVGSGDSSFGDNYAMDAITVCVLGGVSLSGGRGSIVGLFAASFIMSIISNILNLANVNTYFQFVLKGVIVLVTVMVFSIRDIRAEAAKVAEGGE